MDEQPTDTHRKNIRRIREDLKIRYFDAPDLEHVGKNAYRFLCAVSDFATHAKQLTIGRICLPRLWRETH